MFELLYRGLFPVKCLICDKEGAWLCAVHAEMTTAPPNQVSYQYVDKIYSATAYQDPCSKKLIERFKFNGLKSLAPVIAGVMKTQVPAHLWSNTVKIPVPLHWRRHLWRGFNQAELIALNLPGTIDTTSLKRQKHTKQQARLSKIERLENLQNAFVWRGSPVPQKALLIDDVVASGQTLEQAARVLKEAGTETVIAITFARGGQHSSNESPRSTF